MAKKHKSKSKNSSDEYATPRWVVKKINKGTNGVDLDPCSGAEKIPIADERYTIEDDGLANPWFGTVYCNPPYSGPDKWVDKGISESSKDDVELIIFLVKGDSSTNWWHDLYEHASFVCFIDQRLSFGEGNSSASFANHMFVIGEPNDEFTEVLNDFGIVQSIRTQDDK
jgi:phage N-6-adenine-methyltransferase